MSSGVSRRVAVWLCGCAMQVFQLPKRRLAGKPAFEAATAFNRNFMDVFTEGLLRSTRGRVRVVCIRVHPWVCARAPRSPTDARGCTRMHADDRACTATHVPPFRSIGAAVVCFSVSWASASSFVLCRRELEQRVRGGRERSGVSVAHPRKVRRVEQDAARLLPQRRVPGLRRRPLLVRPDAGAWQPLLLLLSVSVSLSLS
jgi:hypothetical protein